MSVITEPVTAIREDMRAFRDRPICQIDRLGDGLSGHT